MRLSSAIALVIGLVMTLLIIPAPASARTGDGPLAGAGHTVSMPGTGRDWYGAYRMGQTTAYCADLMSAPPRRASRWTEAQAGEPLVKQAGLATGAHLAHGDGSGVAQADELADIAWVLTYTGQSPSPDTGAAVEHFVRLRTTSGADQAAREDQRWAAVVAAHPGSRTVFERLTHDAARYAGPYTAHLSWERRPTLADPTGRVQVQALSRAGHPVPGVAVAVRATGALTVITSPGATGGEGSAAVDVALPLPGADPTTGSVQVTLSGLAGATPRVFIPAERTVQRLLVAPGPTTVTGSVSAILEPRFTPEITTRTRDVVAVAGEAAVDVVTLTGGRPGASFSGLSTLYGPFPSLEALASARPGASAIVGTAPFSGTYGPGGGAEAHSAELTFPEPGYYTWVESLEPAEFVAVPPAPSWPQLPETSIVVSPVVTTRLTAAGTAPVGAEVSDELRLDGVAGLAVPDSSRLVIRATGRLVGPMPPRQGEDGSTCEAVDWSAAPVVAGYRDLEVADTGSGLGLAELMPTRLRTPGCYSADAVVTIAHGSRDPIVVRHEVGAPSQTVLVTASPVAGPAETAEPSPGPTAPGLPSTGR